MPKEPIDGRPWRENMEAGAFVGHQAEQRTIKLEVRFVVTGDPQTDEVFLERVRSELVLQFGDSFRELWMVD